MVEQIAVIVYGDGAELGSFKVFAGTLQKQLKSKYKKVINTYANRDYDFLKILESIDAGERIKELHIFSHAIGAGLFLGYKDPVVELKRSSLWNMAFKAKRKVKYLEVVETEVGAVQTDDFKLAKWRKRMAGLQSKFTGDAFIKLWGCNAGIESWVYSDGDVVDPKDNSEPYYWRAFNERNVPKESIAKAMAVFFNVKVYGARSGSSIRVKHKGKWISSKAYKNKIGHWPSGVLPHRLVPDKGAYHAYSP